MPEFAYVYIMTNKRYGTLYVGVTSNLVKRAWEHRLGAVDGFTKEYGLKQLVWYEQHTSMIEAITREKQIKRWHRDWKVNLVHSMNPRWADLYESILGWFDSERDLVAPAKAGAQYASSKLDPGLRRGDGWREGEVK